LSLLSKNLSLLVLWKAFGFRSHHISHWNWRSKGLNYLATLASLSFSVKRKIIRPLLSLTPDLDCWEIHNILSLPWFGWRLQFSFEIFFMPWANMTNQFFFIKQFVIFQAVLANKSKVKVRIHKSQMDSNIALWFSRSQQNEWIHLPMWFNHFQDFFSHQQ